MNSHKVKEVSSIKERPQEVSSQRERPQEVSSQRERPTFFVQENELRAGGVLFYRFNQSKIELLLINKNDRFEDIGGKTDAIDKCIEDTVSREVEEETNNRITSFHIKKQIEKCEHRAIFYNKSKYVLYFIKANKYERKLSTEDFSNKEITDDIARTLHWIPLSDISTIILHPRLSLQSILHFFN
jgi:hypothetical protein